MNIAIVIEIVSLDFGSHFSLYICGNVIWCKRIRTGLCIPSCRQGSWWVSTYYVHTVSHNLDIAVCFGKSKSIIYILDMSYKLGSIFHNINHVVSAFETKSGSSRHRKLVIKLKYNLFSLYAIWISCSFTFESSLNSRSWCPCFFKIFCFLYEFNKFIKVSCHCEVENIRIIFTSDELYAR